MVVYCFIFLRIFIRFLAVYSASLLIVLTGAFRSLRNLLVRPGDLRYNRMYIKWMRQGKLCLKRRVIIGV